MYCPQCGNQTENSAKYCSGCGTGLLQVGRAPKPDAAISPPENLEEFYKAIVGPRNQDYYLGRFSRFDRAGKIGISWNWPALFIPILWLIYRKMWLNLIIYLSMPFLMVKLGSIVAAVTGISEDSIDKNVMVNLYVFFVLLLTPMYANAVYYIHCKKKIAKTRSSPHDLQTQLGELSRKGGTKSMTEVATIVVLSIIFIGILAAIVIPYRQQK
jgi:Protein of unknown function (DUF2628).